jgi:vanillate O-demethylase monooxygenase subunit
VLNDFWYVAARSAEIGAVPLARTLLNVPVAFFRTATGEVAAVRDLCSHRGAPLSRGKVLADRIQCPYHGLQFDASGRCVHIPNQRTIPASAHLRAFPLVEQLGIVWIWMGDPEAADAAAVPLTPWREGAEWNAETTYYYHVRASHLLMTDNLLDLAHVAYVHAGTIGFDPSRLERDPLVTEVEGRRVRNTRILPDVEPGPVVRDWGAFTGTVKRTSISEWVPPCFTFIRFVNEDAAAKVEMRIDHLITPETDRTHHYWVLVSRNFRIADPDLTRRMYEDNDRVHHEDVAIVEATQRSLDGCPDFREMSIAQDRGLNAAHRILAQLATSSAG